MPQQMLEQVVLVEDQGKVQDKALEQPIKVTPEGPQMIICQILVLVVVAVRQRLVLLEHQQRVETVETVLRPALRVQA
jgi:hypothetical protein